MAMSRVSTKLPKTIKQTFDLNLAIFMLSGMNSLKMMLNKSQVIKNCFGPPEEFCILFVMI